MQPSVQRNESGSDFRANLKAALAFVAALHTGEAHTGEAHHGGSERGGSSSRVTRRSGRRRLRGGRVSRGCGDVSAEQSARLLSSFRGRLIIGQLAVGGHAEMDHALTASFLGFLQNVNGVGLPSGLWQRVFAEGGVF